MEVPLLDGFCAEKRYCYGVVIERPWRSSGDPPLVASAMTHQLGRPWSGDKELGRLAVSFDIQWPMWSNSDNAQ